MRKSLKVLNNSLFFEAQKWKRKKSKWKRWNWM